MNGLAYNQVSPEVWLSKPWECCDDPYSASKLNLYRGQWAKIGRDKNFAAHYVAAWLDTLSTEAVRDRTEAILREQRKCVEFAEVVTHCVPEDVTTNEPIEKRGRLKDWRFEKQIQKRVLYDECFTIPEIRYLLHKHPSEEVRSRMQYFSWQFTKLTDDIRLHFVSVAKTLEREYWKEFFAECGLKAEAKHPAATTETANLLPVIHAKRTLRAISSPDFYATPEWREARMKVLSFYNNACMCCGRSRAGGVVIHVDHIKPKSLFPEYQYHLDNLQVLCEDCNLGKSNTIEKDFRPRDKRLEFLRFYQVEPLQQHSEAQVA